MSLTNTNDGSEMAEPVKHTELDRLAAEIWVRFRSDLQALPLREGACKEKILDDLKAKVLREGPALSLPCLPSDVIRSLLEDIRARPDHYLDFSQPENSRLDPGWLAQQDVMALWSPKDGVNITPEALRLSIQPGDLLPNLTRNCFSRGTVCLSMVSR